MLKPCSPESLLYPGPLPQPHSAHPPWPGETHRSGGVTLHVRRTPGPERAELAVYLHGLGGSSTNFTDLAGLVGIRFPGMAIDLPGFGRSAPPGGFDYAPDSHAEVIATFLAGLGHGSVALLIAARRPHLVRTLTLLAPAMPDLRMDPRRLSDPRVALTMLPVVGDSDPPDIDRRVARGAGRAGAAAVLRRSVGGRVGAAGRGCRRVR